LAFFATYSPLPASQAAAWWFGARVCLRGAGRNREGRWTHRDAARRHAAPTPYTFAHMAFLRCGAIASPFAVPNTDGGTVAYLNFCSPAHAALCVASFASHAPHCTQTSPSTWLSFLHLFHCFSCFLPPPFPVLSMYFLSRAEGCDFVRAGGGRAWADRWRELILSRSRLLPLAPPSILAPCHRRRFNTLHGAFHFHALRCLPARPFMPAATTTSVGLRMNALHLSHYFYSLLPAAWTTHGSREQTRPPATAWPCACFALFAPYLKPNKQTRAESSSP